MVAFAESVSPSEIYPLDEFRWIDREHVQRRWSDGAWRDVTTEPTFQFQ